MHFARFWRAILCGALVPAAAASGGDLKIVTRATGERFSSTFTRYYKGERWRQEFPPPSVGRAERPGDPSSPITYIYGHRTATIHQCDLRQVVTLDLDAHEYTTYELDEHGLPAHAKPRKLAPSGGTLEIFVETTDTGERKEIFGFAARRYITRQKRLAGPGAVAQSGETESDGWYIDLEVADRCGHRGKPQGTVTGFVAISSIGDKADRIEVHRAGPQVTGFPVQLTSTSHGQSPLPDGTLKPWTSTFKMEVIELSRAPVDQALFEVPPGFRKVRQLHDQPVQPGLWSRLMESIRALFR